jgi:CopG family transcriptional regulator, nickel-responsive regulator
MEEGKSALFSQDAFFWLQGRDSGNNEEKNRGYGWEEGSLMAKLVRFGISMPEDLLEKFDGIAARRGYSNRSEAIRDLIRDRLVEEEWASEEEEVAGTITLVYDHHIKGLSPLLLEQQHEFHDLILTSTHVHLDHHNCLEVLIIRGRAADAKKVAEKLISLKGIKHGRLTIASTGRGLS